jgi:hypothetical protein
MPDLTVNIQTPSGFEVQGALIPDNITVQQVIAELLGGLSLPRLQNGQAINYSLVLVNRGLVLRSDQTLQDGGVHYGDTIRLVTGVEPSNGNQASRPLDQARNGASSSISDPARQPATPQVASQLAPPVTPAVPPAVSNDWPRDAISVTANDWPRDAAPARIDDWPRDAGQVVTNDWPGSASTSPVFESPEETSQSFAMVNPGKTVSDQTVDSTLATGHFEIDGGWTANELSEWLGHLELAYSRLNAFLCLSDEDITRAGAAADNKAGSGSMSDAFSLLVAAGNRRSSSLKLSRINFAAQGLLDLVGDPPPIKIMTQIINGWRHENLAGGNGSRPNTAKPATAALIALVQRAEQLSAMGHGVFVEGFIHHAFDAAREALEAMAKDIRIKKVSWSGDGNRP